MNVSVTLMRVLLICLNFGLATAFAAHYGYSHFWPKEEALPDKMRQPGEFRYTEVEETGGPDRIASMASVDNALNLVIKPPQPPATPKLTEKPEEKPEDGDPVEGEGPAALPDGPLAEKWEYTWAMIVHDEGKRYSQIRLEKKEEEAKTMTPGGLRQPGRRSVPSSGVRPVPSRSGRPRSGIPQINPGDRIEFQLDDRHYKDDDLGVDFYIHDVDESFFVYWVPDQPKKFYSLKRKRQGEYLGVLRAKSLLNKPKEEEESAEGDPKDKEKEKKIVVVPDNIEDLRESDYQKLLVGEAASGALQPKKSPVQSKLRPIAAMPPPPAATGAKASAIASQKLGTAGGGSAVTPPGAPAAGGAPQPMSDAEKLEAAKELGGAIREIEQSGKLTEKDRQGLQELKEVLQGPAKK
jgi:hypothetical protein